MKPSYYNCFFPFKDQYILFNTLRGAIFVVDEDAKTVLETGDLEALGDLKEVFQKSGIIVEDELDEQDMYSLIYNGSKYNSVSTSLHVITTYACNLSCIYCYEGRGELEHRAMDVETGQRAVQFIKDLALNNNSRGLGIELFGGEPLLNMPINELIIEDLSGWCKEKGLDFSVNAITNGTLCSEETVERLAQYGCSFLVTLDGPEGIHDQRRVYKNGKGTFTDIMEGLYRIRDSDSGTMIRINVDEGNKHDIVTLLEELKEKGLGKAVISIKPVFNTSPACLSYGYCMPDVEGMSLVNELYAVGRKMGFRTEEPERPTPQGACSAQRASYFTIDPYLRLFKCAILPPYEKNAVGVVNEEGRAVFNYVNVDFMSRDPLHLDKCRECQLIPLCRGGCPAEVYETQGTTHGYACRKSGFRKMLEENLVQFVIKKM
ncbi:MAG: radical SAM protein [Theionarchaea archaeon]|nr:radical SAM protein [Theionarchaea archaeon]